MSSGRAGLALLFLLLWVWVPSSSTAQDEPGVTITLPPDLAEEQREAFLSALERLQVPISVDDMSIAATDAREQPELAHLIDRFDAAVAALPELPGLVGAWFGALEPGSAGGSFLALVAIALALALGAAVEILFHRLTQVWRQRLLEPRQGFTSRLLAALSWFGLDALGLAAFFSGAMVGGWALVPGTEVARLSLAIVIAGIVLVRFFYALVHLLNAPRHRALRLVDMSDEDARTVVGWLLILLILNATARAIRDFLVQGGASAEAATLLGLMVAVAALVSRLALIWTIRQPIRSLIHATGKRDGGQVSPTARRLGDIWHLIFGVLVVFDFAGTVYGQLSTSELAAVSGQIGAMTYIVVLPYLLGAFRGVVDDRLIRGDEDARSLGLARAIRALGQGIIVLGTLLLIASAWGADPLAGGEAGIGSRIVGALLGAATAALVGWAVWAGVQAMLDRYSPDASGDDEVSEDGMGKQGSRIETLLPVIRNFLFVTVLVLTIMTALSALGVNIGPLLAGAGVIGLAIGFGAQTLVKDVITGFFYLVEDAFRKGEYIESDAGKGVVEKISMRSVQLRHHRGPLSTIPFGSMGNILNHSRDWVKIKLLLRIPFDADLERVRKVVKRVGQEMLADEALGPQFLQPVKSQGVMDVDDSAFIIGVKFVCRPGEQFLLKREAYSRIKRAFAENGIEFASRRVTVEAEGNGSPAAAAAASQASAPSAAE